MQAYSHPPAQFIKGEHVELLHPSPAHLQIVPAVVSEIHGDQTMSVEILDFRLEGNRKKITKICNSQSLDVLPIHWCKKNGVRLSRPAGTYSYSALITYLLVHCISRLEVRRWWIQLAADSWRIRRHVGSTKKFHPSCKYCSSVAGKG